MAKKSQDTAWKPNTSRRKKKRTSIVSSKNSRPKNKHKRKNKSKYRGQGK